MSKMKSTLPAPGFGTPPAAQPMTAPAPKALGQANKMLGHRYEPVKHEGRGIAPRVAPAAAGMAPTPPGSTVAMRNGGVVGGKGGKGKC